MRQGLRLAVVLIVGMGVAWPSPAWAAKALKPFSHQTFAITVGWENSRNGIGINAYFPDTVTVHVGDTIRWVQNSNEIHTVTFLADLSQPDLIVPGQDPTVSPLMFNPVAVDPCVPTNGQYDGSGYANSGLMGRESGQAREFSLTFTAEGTFDYVCLVHEGMSGQVTVVAQDVPILIPFQVKNQGRQQLAQALAQVPGVIQKAQEQIRPAEDNGDGSLTHFVMVGYAEGQIDLMQFLPDKLKVHPGDTVVWDLSPENMAPHTVTFLNGQPEPELVIPVPQQSGPPLLYLNPAVLAEAPSPSMDLTRTGIYNSGLMDPGAGPKTYTLKIGSVTPGLFHYLCQLHDTSGMKATLTVVPETQRQPRCGTQGWPWWGSDR